MKIKDLQPRLLFLARLSFKMEGEIKSFPDQKKKAKRAHLHQTSIVRDSKENGRRRRRRRDRRRERERRRRRRRKIRRRKIEEEIKEEEE